MIKSVITIIKKIQHQENDKLKQYLCLPETSQGRSIIQLAMYEPPLELQTEVPPRYAWCTTFK